MDLSEFQFLLVDTFDTSEWDCLAYCWVRTLLSMLIVHDPSNSHTSLISRHSTFYVQVRSLIHLFDFHVPVVDVVEYAPP